MTSRNVANLIQDPAVPGWCLLTGDYSPTVLLSKFKLYGSAKEKCHHYGKIAGWQILVESARPWSMTETVWCIRSRLAWSDGGFLFWGGFFVWFFFSWLLSPTCAMTKLHIVTLWVRQKSTRGSCLSPSWGKDWILASCYKKRRSRVTKGRNVAQERKINDGASLTSNSNWNWILKTTSKRQRGNTRLISTFFFKNHKNILYLWERLCKTLNCFSDYN